MNTMSTTIDLTEPHDVGRVGYDDPVFAFSALLSNEEYVKICKDVTDWLPTLRIVLASARYGRDELADVLRKFDDDEMRMEYIEAAADLEEKFKSLTKLLGSVTARNVVAIHDVYGLSLEETEPE